MLNNFHQRISLLQAQKSMIGEIVIDYYRANRAPAYQT